MAEKRINGRLVQKHDIQSNWERATNFTPMAGEIIIYDIDSTHVDERIKIGDGIRNVNDLPFYAGSWEDLTDRPFWSDGPTTVAWDGNTNGLVASSDGTCYKVSNLKPNATEIIGGKLTFSNGSTVEVTSDIVENYGYIISIYYNSILINTSNGSTYNYELSVTLPEPGIYFQKNTYNQLVSFSYGDETINCLDEKYIPNTIARVSDIPEQIIDDELSNFSTNPVQNKVVSTAISELNALVGDISVSEQINFAVSSFVFDCIKMRDKTNGHNYVLEFIDGQLVSSCCCSNISISTLPEKTTYVEGESLDTSGMVVTAVCEDGSVKNIKNYVTSIEPGVGSKTASIIYTECGVTYTATFAITVNSIEEALIDFEYTAESDGTYTITGWKGTLNGVESTECVIPDNPLINV